MLVDIPTTYKSLAIFCYVITDEQKSQAKELDYIIVIRT